MHLKQHLQLGGALLLSLSLLSGCGQREMRQGSAKMISGASDTANAATAAGNSATEVTLDAPVPSPTGKSPDSKKDANDPLTLASLKDAEPDRYLIKNATMSLETPDVRKVADQIIAFARSSHGYVSDSHETVDALGTRAITIQARVLASQFDASMQQVEGLGKILDKQVNTEDVTEEFVDSSARLRNLKSAELRLLDHLTRTGKLSDTLLIEKELTRVRQEVEQIEGRLKFLAHRVAYSTFNITVHETPKPQTIIPPQTFSSGKVASDAARSVVEFGQSLLSITIWLGVWGIFWLPVALLVRALLHRRITAARSAK